MNLLVKSRSWLAYVGAQALLVFTFFAMPDSGLRSALQVGVAWAGAAFVLLGSLRYHLPAKAVWLLFAAGLFSNASGILVEHVLKPASHPSWADAFYLGIFPCLISGLAILVFRRSVRDDSEGMSLGLGTAISTIMTAAMGVLAWELLIAPQPLVKEVGLLGRMTVTAYPMGDLIVIALLLRLFLIADLHNLAFCLMLASLLCFLGADVGWAVYLRTGTPVTPGITRLLETTSLSAFALMGAAVYHPSICRLAQPAPQVKAGVRPAVWGSLVVSLLTAPIVLLIEALFDRLYGMGPP
jgi:diguanylate cyclase